MAAAGNHDLPFAKELYEAADPLRHSVESAEYKHLVLGLLFLKYISDSFERRRAWLDASTRDPANSDYFTDDDEARAAILEGQTTIFCGERLNQTGWAVLLPEPSTGYARARE